MYHEMDADYNENNLAFLEKKVFGRRVSVFLAGDLHHYRRHADESGTFQKITCGGGGAFLHPTHKPRVDVITEQVADELKAEDGVRTFRKMSAFPDEETSSGLTYRNLNFVGQNPWFGILTAILYPLCWWSFTPPLLSTPAPVGFAFLILAAFYLFTDTHSRIYRSVAGIVHGVAHLLAALVIGVAIAHVFGFSESQLDWKSHWIVVFAMILPSWLIGSEIMGAYLLISLNIFGRHNNEAFSSLAIQDFKSFLRLHIDTKGELTIYPIGIKHVARKWRATGAPAPGPSYEPNDPEYTPARLIESPVVVRQTGSLQMELTQKLSSSEPPRGHFDVAVVGSGYGGSIAASRMSRARRADGSKLKVCVLERGKEFRPGEYPNTTLEAGKEMQLDSPLEHIGSATGLYDFRLNDDINVFLGCGLGGTSLVNANVSLEAEAAVFEDQSSLAGRNPR